MGRFLLVTVIVCCCFLRQSTGLEFTLDRHVDRDSDGGAVCGVLVCTNTITGQGETSTSPDDVNTVSSLTIYKKNTGSEGTQPTMMATLTSKYPDIKYVRYDGTKVTGNITRQQASLQLMLVTNDNCQADFTCQLRALDTKGREVVSTSNLVQPSCKSWTPAVAFELVEKMGSKLSQLSQSMSEGLNRLEDKQARVEDQIGHVEKRMEDLESTMTSLDNSLNVNIATFENHLDEKTINLLKLKPGTKEYILGAMIRSVDLNVFKMIDVLSDSEKGLNNNTNQCMKIVQSERQELNEMEKRILDKTVQNFQDSFKNFTKDLTQKVDADLDSLEVKLEKDIEEVLVIVKSSDVKIDSLLDDGSAAPMTCVKGMASALPQNASKYSVFLSDEEYGMKSPFLCDTMTDGGGWIVIQRRINGSLDFYRDWATYKEGFGDLASNFWLGNDNIHNITSTGTYELRVELEYGGKSGMAHYNNFYLGGEATNYTLHIGEFTGTIMDSLTYHNGMQFSTYDVGNDVSDKKNCAVIYIGAWWFRNCYSSDLNGQWGAIRGVRWKYFTGSGSATYTEMKIRRTD